MSGPELVVGSLRCLQRLLVEPGDVGAEGRVQGVGASDRGTDEVDTGQFAATQASGGIHDGDREVGRHALAPSLVGSPAGVTRGLASDQSTLARTALNTSAGDA